MRNNDRLDRGDRTGGSTGRYAKKIPGLCVSMHVVSLRGPFIIVRRWLTSDRLNRSAYYSTIVRAYSDLSRGPKLRCTDAPCKDRVARVLATKVLRYDYMSRRVLYAVIDT